MSNEEKGCNNCIHNYVCQFKPQPYMGTHSGGIKFTISYKAFAYQLYQLYGRNCSNYKLVLNKHLDERD